MKKSMTVVAAFAVLLACFMFRTKSSAVEGGTFQKYEYVTIHWAGRENTHLIRSNGKVEMLGPILNRVVRPDRTDDRAFYMSLAMNAVAKEGYEFAGIYNDDVVMKRPTSP